jgi:hypothetical protein
MGNEGELILLPHILQQSEETREIPERLMEVRSANIRKC